MHRIKPLRKIPDIDQLEWDFSSCPNAELRDCYFYEFMRNRPEAVTFVQNWRAANTGAKFDDWKSFYSRPKEASGFNFYQIQLFTFCPEWPEKPYLTIPAEERNRRCNLIVRPPPLRDISRALVPVNIAMFVRDQIEKRDEPTLEMLERSVLRKSSANKVNDFVTFKIDWRHPNRQLEKRFAAWLRLFRPKEVHQLKIRGNAGAVMQMKKDLKALGAWRLMKQHKLNSEEAARLTSNCNPKELPLIEGQSNWLRACTHAERLLQQPPILKYT